MKFKQIQGLVDKYIKRLKKDNAISIIQLGSSLRKHEFMGNSDLDLLVIYKNPVKKGLKFEYHNEIEVNLIRRGKKQYIKLLNEGNPVDLIALNFGRRRFEDFRDNLIKVDKIRPNQRGKFLLACEDFAILAYKIVLNLRLPKINCIISKLKTEYRLDHFSGYFLSPEKKKAQISFRLKNGEFKFLDFDLEKITEEA